MLRNSLLRTGHSPVRRKRLDGAPAPAIFAAPVNKYDQRDYPESGANEKLRRFQRPCYELLLYILAQPLQLRSHHFRLRRSGAQWKICFEGDYYPVEQTALDSSPSTRSLALSRRPR